MNYILAVLIAKIFFVSLCILQPLDLIAQDNRIDSLKGILKTAKEDTSKVNALNFLADLTTTLDAVKGMKYAQEAFDLSNKLHYTAGIGTAYVVMGSSYLNQGKLDDAIVYLNKGLKICHDCGNKFDEAWAYNNLGVINERQGNYEEALKLYAISLNLKKQIGYKKGMARSYLNIAGIYIQKGQRAKAIENNKLSLKLRQEINDQTGVAECFTNIGVIQTDEGKFDEAYKSYSQALNIYNNTNNIQLSTTTVINIGYNYQQQGLFNKALEQYKKGLQMAEDANDEYVIAFCKSSIGSIYLQTGEYEEALKNILASLQLRQEMKDEHGVAQCYSNLGYIYREQGNYDKALKYYSEALIISQKIGNKKSTADDLNSVGNIYYLQKKITLALEKYKNSLSEFEELEDKHGIAQAKGNIGMIYAEMGKYDDAFLYYFASLSLRKEIGDQDGIATSNFHIAEVYKKQGKYEDSRKLLSESLKISKEINNKDLIMNAYLNFSSLDSIQASQPQITSDLKYELWKSAYNNYMLYSIYKDSLFNKDNSGRIAELLTKYETEKKEREILLLQKDQKIKEEDLKRQRLIKMVILIGSGVLLTSSFLIFLFYKRRRDSEQKQKETSLNLQVSETEMKALRSQMNPHFIFNALQSIQTFLLNHQPEDANIYLLKFSKLMRLVLENSQHSDVPLKEDMKALELYMQLESIRLKHPFTFQFHIADGIDTEETTIPPLILQPFVENAIWHGLQYKPEPGHIDIYISKQNDTLHAVVEDNGVGRDMSKKVAQPMLLKKESLGMKLTEERLKILNELKKIKAHFTISDLFTKDEQPAGTKVELSLPL